MKHLLLTLILLSAIVLTSQGQTTYNVNSQQDTIRMCGSGTMFTISITNTDTVNAISAPFNFQFISSYLALGTGAATSDGLYVYYKSIMFTSKSNRDGICRR